MLLFYVSHIWQLGVLLAVSYFVLDVGMQYNTVVLNPLWGLIRMDF